MTPLTPARWAQIQALFGDVVDLGPEAQAERLAATCRDDPELRVELEALLRADAEAPPLVTPNAALFGVVDEGQRFGPYRVVRAIGGGGMGDVYLAERTDGQFAQQVALKVMRPGLDQRRFDRERSVLARLVHANIARLYDGGLTEDGRPWFAMEPVAGLALDEHCRERKLTLRERLRLFCEVCTAVQYAHRQLVVHRDLKPSNILVTDEGVVKLLDFGIAKLLAPEEGAPAIDATGLLAMTPEYAAPEQVRGEPVSTATDVYALGVMLFQLVSGRRPYQLENSSPAELLRVVCETVPPAPSTMAPRIPRDLDAICLKALRKEPERRYASAEQLREDIGRLLDDRPVLARRDSLVYRATKFLRRHVVGASVVVALAALSAIYGLRLAREHERVRAQAQRADQVAHFLERLFVAANPDETRGARVTARELLDDARLRIASEHLAPDIRANLLRVMGDAYASLGSFDEAAALFDESLHLLRAAREPDERELAQVLRDLGDVRREQARFAEAAILLDESLWLRRVFGGGDGAAVAETLDALGALHLDRGEPELATASYEESLAIRRRLELPEAADTLQNLGLVARDLGDFDLATRRYREALALHRAHLGDSAPQTVSDVFALADILRKQDRLAEAEPLYRQALQQRRKLYTNDHPDVANSLNHLARLLYSEGRYEEAEPLFREGLEMNRRIYGDKHDAVAASLGGLAGLYLRRGQPDAAEPLYQESLRILRAIHGDEHPYVAAAMNSLAAVAAIRGDMAEAIRRYREALALHRRLLPPSHPDIARPLIGLGRALLATGAAAEAEPLLREAHDLRAAALPAGHVALGEAKLRWAECLIQLGRRTEAETLLSQALEALRASHDAAAAAGAREAAQLLARLHEAEPAPR